MCENPNCIYCQPPAPSFRPYPTAAGTYALYTWEPKQFVGPEPTRFRARRHAASMLVPVAVYGGILAGWGLTRVLRWVSR